MFAEEIRRAAESAPRVKLPDVAALMWRAYGAGQITEAEAEALSNLIAFISNPSLSARHMDTNASLAEVATALFDTHPPDVGAPQLHMFIRA